MCYVLFKNWIFNLLILLLITIPALASNTLIDSSLVVDQQGINVHTYQTKGSDIATFKAEATINASLGSILAVMFDNDACEDWVHSCIESKLIKSVNFNERYHYQVCDLPFPFEDRDFIFHSILIQDPVTKVINITMSVESDYCQYSNHEVCEKHDDNGLVHVKKSLGQYTLEQKQDGTKITWVQHTEPGGELPSWLVNQFLIDVPVMTLKNLSKKANEERYSRTSLKYNGQGMAIGLNRPEPSIRPETFAHFPSF